MTGMMYFPTVNVNYNMSTSVNSGPLIFGSANFNVGKVTISSGGLGPNDNVTKAILVE
jgi:hypothetical protein